MAARDYQLAKDFLNAFKVKSASPSTHGYVLSKYGWQPYDRIFTYARRFFPPGITREHKEDSDYIKYILAYQNSDPELSLFFKPETTPDESDKFHEDLEKDGREPTPEEEAEDKENKSRVEEAESDEAPEAEEITEGMAAAEAVPVVTEEQYQSGARGYAAGYEEYRAQQAKLAEGTVEEKAALPQPTSVPVTAATPPPIPATPTPTVPPTHAQQEAARAVWMAHETPPAKIPPSAPPAGQTSKKKGGEAAGGKSFNPKTRPKPKFAVLGGRVVAINPKPINNQKPSYTKQEVEKLRRITEESRRAVVARQQRLAGGVAGGLNFGQRLPEPPIVLATPRRALPRLRAPSFIKDLGNRFQIAAKPVALFAVIGAALGTPLGPLGMLMGAAGGVAATKFFPGNDEFSGGESSVSNPSVDDNQPSGGGYNNPGSPQPQYGGGAGRGSRNPLVRQGGQLAKNAAKQLAKQVAKQAAEKLAAAAAANPVTWIVIAVIILIILVLFLFMHGLPTASLCFPGRPCGVGNFGGGAPVNNNNNPNGGNLLACTFTTGSTGSGQVKIGSPDLANYINDVANKVGIPASVLAGVLAIEHGSALASTDPQFFTNDYDNTPSFTNQAFGFAQFEPPVFDDVFSTHQNEINQLFGLNKTSDDVNPSTPQVKPPPNDSVMRITSIKDSIILAAFKLRDAKNGAAGPSAAWNNNIVQAVASNYQGGCDNNYCNNLIQSFQSCSGSSNLAGGAGPTPPPASGDLEQTIQSEFGVDFKGFGNQQLQWARELLWAVSNTNFDTLIKGAQVQATGNNFSQQVGCAGGTSVLIDRYNSNSTDPNYFKFLISHELGHFIQNCTSRQVHQETAFENAVASDRSNGAPYNGFISYYAENTGSDSSCPSSVQLNEDYADMISYYLNPNSGYSSAYGCGPQTPPNPYSGGGHPAHSAVVKSVLGNYP